MLFQALLQREDDEMVYVWSKAEMRHYVNQGYTVLETYTEYLYNDDYCVTVYHD